MRRPHLLLTLLAAMSALFVRALAAQTITGTLIDSTDGRPLAKVPVRLLRIGYAGLIPIDSARTTRRGQFRFTAPEGGRYQLEFGGAAPHVLRSPIDSLTPDTTLERRYALPTRAWSAAAPLPVELVSTVAQPRRGTRAPRYPERLRNEGVIGCVLALFAVDTTGAVEPASVRILISTDSAFTTSVRTAVPQLRFTPARLGRTPVRQQVTAPFAFTRAGFPEPQNCDPALATLQLRPR